MPSSTQVKQRGASSSELPPKLALGNTLIKMLALFVGLSSFEDRPDFPKQSSCEVRK
jgi:hypothetical protein